MKCDTHFHMHAVNVTVSVATDTSLCLHQLMHAHACTPHYDGARAGVASSTATSPEKCMT